MRQSVLQVQEVMRGGKNKLAGGMEAENVFFYENFSFVLSFFFILLLVFLMKTKKKERS